MFSLYIDGEDSTTDKVSEPQYGGESLRIQLEDIATSSGYNPECTACGNEIWQETDPTGQRGEAWTDGSGEEDQGFQCGIGEASAHHPPALHWANSASITLDPDDEAIHVSISIGDPRGAFVMTVRQLSDGSLVLHHPYPGEGFAHMETTELHPGTLAIK